MTRVHDCILNSLRSHRTHPRFNEVTMTITPDDPEVSAAARPTADAAVDADTAYLEKLGYKQELNRSLGLFSAFGVQFTRLPSRRVCSPRSSLAWASSALRHSGRSWSAGRFRCSLWVWQWLNWCRAIRWPAGCIRSPAA